MINYRYKYLSNSSHMYEINKKFLYEHSNFWYCLVFLFAKLSTCYNHLLIAISYICRGQEIITKLVYYAMNITFIEAKLFAIRYRINHVVTLLISLLSLIPF